MTGDRLTNMMDESNNNQNFEIKISGILTRDQQAKYRDIKRRIEDILYEVKDDLEVDFYAENKSTEKSSSKQNFEIKISGRLNKDNQEQYRDIKERIENILDEVNDDFKVDFYAENKSTEQSSSRQKNSNNTESSGNFDNNIHPETAENRTLESMTKILIMFPYRGYTDGGIIFRELINNCRQYSKYPPIVVVNRDTISRGEAEQFIKNKGLEIETLPVWSVNTCQMWLAGWGKIIDDNEKNEQQGKDEKIERIIQLPGDIKRINRDEFYANLQDFCIADCDISDKDCCDIVVGDFKTREFVGKSLIDSYGTFPLLANWFPEISKEIFALSLYKPRTEFLNLRVDTLKELLEYHPFAYEQTLNMLIHSWDDTDTNKKWKYKIKCFNLGSIEDDSGYRQYQGCLDQVERTERMLKYIWRKKKEKALDTNDSQNFKEFMDTYDFLCQRSQAICETARITIRSLLGLGQ